MPAPCGVRKTIGQLSRPCVRLRSKDALGTEALLQASGCTEDPAIDADIFAKDYNIRIIRQRSGESQIDRVD